MTSSLAPHQLRLPILLAGEMSPAVTRGDWKRTAPLTVAVAVIHPQGGFTVALPPQKNSTVREYSGRYHNMETARDAAASANQQAK